MTETNNLILLTFTKTYDKLLDVIQNTELAYILNSESYGFESYFLW